MNSYGFFRTAAAGFNARTADISHNSEAICRLIEKAYSEDVSMIVFPELSVTGSKCGDLFYQKRLISEAENGMRQILEKSLGREITIVCGTPISVRDRLYACAVVIRDGRIKGIVPKSNLGTGESRWFSSGSDFLNSKEKGKATEVRFAGQTCMMSPAMLFETGDVLFGIESGSDLISPLSPSSFMTLSGAQVIACLAAENEGVVTDAWRRNLLSAHSSKNHCGYIYASASGESTQDGVYSGSSYIFEDGTRIASSERYSDSDSLTIADIDIDRINISRRIYAASNCTSPDGTSCSASNYIIVPTGSPYRTDFGKKLFRKIDPHPFIPAEELDDRCREIIAIQVNALKGRLQKIRSKAVIGISGGLDSTLALLVAVLAFDSLRKDGDEYWNRENIIAVTMPGFGTTKRTKNNAWELMQALGVTCREISIVPACLQHFNDINHDPEVHDAVYENSQARERTQILMDIANQCGGIVVGTGDLSELALGWATYNGDHMSMYGVNAGIPKTLVRSLVRWAAENRFGQVKEILLDIADTPISPELLPANAKGEIQQVTEDLVGPYELHDFFIYNFMRNGYCPEKIYFLALKAFAGSYDEQTVMKWLKTFIRRFFNQQFKRSCMPDGPKVGSVSLSPRGDWQMPSDAWSSSFEL